MTFNIYLILIMILREHHENSLPPLYLDTLFPVGKIGKNLIE